MFKRKLFKHAFSKRALPIILSVAMIFQSMPATAMAAEDAVAVEETVEDTTDEQTATEAAEPASEQDDSEAEPSEAEPTEDTETPASTEETKEDDQVVASTEETKEDSETPASTEKTEEDSETPASTEETKEDNETPVSTEEPSQDATVPETTEVAEESTTTEELDAEQKELTAAQIIIDTNALEDSLNNLNYNDGVVSGTYVPEGKLFDSLVNDVLKGSQDVISVKIDGKTNEHLNEKLAFKWSKVTGEILAELKGDTPTDAGTYRLEISLEAIDGLCNAAENVSINFEIKQAELTVNLEDLEMPEIGSKIADFVANLKENYQLRNSENEELNKETYVKDIKVTVKDSISGTEITDLETKFEKDKDYSYSISVELTDSNYTVKDIGVRDIVLQGDITTTMEVTLPKNLVYTYGDEIKLPVAGTDYTVKIMTTVDGKETEVEVPADGITATWLDADGNEIELSEGAAPSDAGTYYVLLTYVDATGRYKGCDNKLKNKKDKTSIRVIINPVSIYVKPKFEKTKDGITEYTDGKTRDDILQDVKYDLIKTVGDTTLTETEFDKKTGWGVSYNNENKTQYYEPVFELQVSKPETDKDGKVTWSSYETVNEDEKLIGGGELAKYRVVFTGKKAVYNGNRVSSEVDINNATNSAVPNFKVDDTKETLEKYAVELTITKANVEIDISKYGIADKYFKKTFDGTPIYESRADYKMASVGGNEEGLSYQWFEAHKKEQKDESGNVTAVTYERGDERFTFNYTNSEKEALYYVAPVEAGTYMLVISYKDPNHEKSAEDVEIIYEIERRKIAAEVSTGTEGNKVTVYSGTSILDYAEKLAESITTEIKKSNSNKVNGNKLDDLVPDNMLSLWEYDGEYVLVPVIERQDNITGEWKEVVDPDTFIEGSHYRIGFGVDIQYMPYPEDFCQNNYQSYDIIETEDGTSWNYYLSNYVDVTVEKMGTVPLELKADEAAIGAIKEYDGIPFTIPTEAVTVYNQNTGELVSDVTVEFQLFDETIGEYVNIEKAINGGKYTLYASFDGNAVYAPLEMTQVGASNAFEITKRAISISPVLNSTIEAGQNSTRFDKIIQQISVKDEDDDTINIPVLNISGILDTETISDKAMFTPNIYYYDGEELFGYPAIESYDFSVKKTDGSVVPDSVLKSDIDYYVVSNVTLRDPYNRNYKVTNTKATFIPVRGKASVSKTSYGEVSETSLKDYTEVAEGTKEVIHTIVPREGIPYVHNNAGLKDADGKDIVGNLFIFQIKAPKEFYQYGNNESYYPSMTNAFNPIFKNEIEREVKKYGGYLFTTEEQAKRSGKIVVAFRTEGEENKNPSFKVRWSDGYLEEFTVDFNGAVLEANLRKAVAPKSLTFNAPLKKMVIGEKQQLDVKVTKKKLDDIICLKYEVDNTDVLSITEDTGAVVALSVGAATVKVIPCYEDEEGVKQPIEGAKAATVKISVVDVTAPKIKTVTALDISAVVTYPKLPDGYRREIYVLEDPKAKAKEDAFITAIEKLKNGDWKSAGFATAPIYTATESYDAKSKTSRVPISGLKAGSQYTVYVRNVSGIRTLADGSSVAVSAKGAVKSFKTTASQVQALAVRFDEEHYEYVSNIGGYAYTADVSEKKIPSITVGTFLEQAADLNANENDEIEYKLPIAKEKLEHYAQPKLSYIVTYNYEDYYEDKAVDSYTVKIGNRYYAPSSVAKIDKKGNVTLTGKGWVDIVVYDAVTDKYGYGTLYVTADATKMTVPKSVKVRVGELIRIEDYITYFAGKQKLTNYTPNIEIGWLETGDNDAFSISSTEYGHYITAKEAKKSTQLQITDRNVSSENDSNVVYLTINSTDISPVKNLKVTEAVDKYATVSFTYPRMNAYEYEDDPDPDTYINQLYFRIQIIDAAKNIVSDKYYNYNDLDHVSDFKKKTDTFTTYIGFDKPLVRKSSYTVSVTATYLKKEAVSKAVTKNFKTTDIPAAYQAEYGYNLGHEYGEEQNFFPFSKEAGSDYKNTDGGIDIKVNGNVILKDYKALTSNNTYTLVAVPQNVEAKNRLSDTLTWKSTNTKVATVKANAGSYTATLKTLKKGVTKIELTSKVTKKLIARWTVFVNATGEASYFFGEYEPDNGSDLDVSVEYGDIEILTLDNPVKLVLAAGEGKIVKFVAPEYGSYNFKLNNSNCSLMRCDIKGTLQRALEDVALQKGETCYLKVVPTSGSGKAFSVILTASGILYETWSGVGKYNLEKKGSIAFTAPEDNYYIIKNSNDAIVYQEGLKAGQTKVVSLSKGTYTVSMRTPIVKLNEGATKDQNIEGKTTNWYVFEAPSDMSYEFGLTSTNNAVTLKLYDKITSGNGTTTSKKTLNKGDKVYIGVENKSLTAVKTDLTITPDAERGVIDVTKETSKSVSLEKAGEGKFVQYIIPEDGFYRFKTTGTVEDTTAKAAVPNLSVYYTDKTTAPTQNWMGDYYEGQFDKDEIVYVYVESPNDKTTVTIKTTKISVKGINFGENASSLSSDKSYYKFTADKDGDYSFKAVVTPRTGENPITPNATVNSYKGKEFNIASFSNNVSYRGLKKGDIIYLQVFTDDTENKQDNAKIIVSRVEATPFTDTWSGKLAADSEKWLQFKATEDTIYYFYQKTTQTQAGKGNVSVEKYQQLNGNYPTNYYNGTDNFSVGCKAGESFYLKLSVTGGEVTYSINAVPVQPGKVPPTEFKIPAKSEIWFVYTAPVKARYSVNLTGNDAKSCTISKGTSISSNMISIGIASEVSLDAGETVYYKVENRTEAEKTVKLTIEPIKTTALNLKDKPSDTVKLTDGSFKWYSFTAETAGRYSFNTTAKAAEGQVASANIMYFADANGEKKIEGEYNPEQAVLVKANETIYIRVKVNGADADVTTTVKAIKPASLTAKIGTPITIEKKDLAEGSYEWYDIKGEGTYTINLSDATGAYTAKSVRNNDSFETEYFPVTVTLGENDTYTLAIKANEAKFGYKVTSTVRDVKELTLTKSVDGKLKTGEDLYVSFKVPENGRYAISLEGLKDDVSSTITYVGGDYENQYGNEENYYTFVSSINKKITFKINVTSEASVSFKVKAEKVSAADITATGTATMKASETPAGYMKWYSYTAPEDGKYIVKASDAKAILYADYDNDLSGGFDRYYRQMQEVTMEKGVTYYYAMYYGAKPAADVTFSVKKATVNKLDKEYTVKVAGLVSDEKTYISYTAPEDGRYLFTCTEQTVSAQIYDSVDDMSIKDSLSFNTDRPMEAGEEIVFAVSTNVVPKTDYKITVSKVVPVVLEASKEVKKELAPSETLWVSFKASETAKYKFEMTNVYDTYVYEDLMKDKYTSTLSNGQSYSVDNGKIIYLKLIPDASAANDSGKVAVSIKSSVDTKMEMLKVAENVKDIAATGDKWAYFTAETAGFYKFAVTGDCTVYAYTNADGSYDRYMTDGNSYTRGLGKGDSLYFKIQNNGSSVATEKITITKEKDVKELVVGKEDIVTGDENNYAYYVLTAIEKGTYNIITNNDARVSVNDKLNDAYNWSYTSTLQLEKGAVKYIRIYTSSYDCTVTCTKVSEQSVTLDKPLELTLQKGESVLVNYTAQNYGYYRIKFVANNTVAYKYCKNDLDWSLNSNSSSSRLWPVEMNFGDERNLLISAREDNTEVTVSIESLQSRYIEGETSSNLFLNAGEAQLIEWYPTSSGSYRITANANYSVRYLSGKTLDDMLESSGYNCEQTVAQRAGMPYYLYIEALSDGTSVTFTATKETRPISVGSSYDVKLNSGESETFTFAAPQNGTYIFYSTGLSTLKGEISSSNRSTDVYSNGEDNNFCISKDLVAGEQAEITVTKLSNDYYDSCLYVYMLHDQTEEIISPDTLFNPSITLEANQEEWFLFTVAESGWYEFLIDSSACMKLYDYDTKEVLGTKEYPYGNNSIKVGLSEGTTVWLRTWYNYHSSGTYDVTVQQGALNSYTNSQTLRYSSMNQSISVHANSNYQQTEILYNYSQSYNYNESGIKLKFSVQDSYDDLHLALYLGSDTEPVAEGNNELEYAVDSENFNAIKLIVWRDAYKEFSTKVYCSVEEFEYETTLDSSKSLYIPQNGSATVIYPAVSEAGKYVFYSTDNVVATIYKNDTELTLDNESLSDTGFQYTLDLVENDIIKFIVNTDDGESRSISLYGYKITDDLASAELPTKNTIVAVSKKHTIKIITFTNNSKGTYTFNMVPSENYANCEFELTVDGKTYTDWNIATDEVELEENAEVTLKLWNTDKYQEASATLEVTYTATETSTEPTEPENPEEGGDNSDGSDESNNTNE